MYVTASTSGSLVLINFHCHLNWIYSNPGNKPLNISVTAFPGKTTWVGMVFLILGKDIPYAEQNKRKKKEDIICLFASQTRIQCDHISQISATPSWLIWLSNIVKMVIHSLSYFGQVFCRNNKCFSVTRKTNDSIYTSIIIYSPKYLLSCFLKL